MIMLAMELTALSQMKIKLPEVFAEVMSIFSKPKA